MARKLKAWNVNDIKVKAWNIVKLIKMSFFSFFVVVSPLNRV